MGSWASASRAETFTDYVLAWKIERLTIFLGSVAPPCCITDVQGEAQVHPAVEDFIIDHAFGHTPPNRGKTSEAILTSASPVGLVNSYRKRIPCICAC
eukprot:1958435-Amphidinium_carterae.1